MCKSCSKISLPKIFLLAAIVISASLILGVIKSIKERPQITPPPAINKIEISADAKSILNADTKEVIFTINDTQKYLKDSGYFYNPDTFQTTNAKYEGDCFISVALSNSKDKIVFSSGCLPGDLPQAWIGVYDIPDVCAPTAYPGGECHPLEKIKFLIGGSGRNFVWSADDKTIAYEANLGLSGMTETRTIDSATGEILKNN